MRYLLFILTPMLLLISSSLYADAGSASGNVWLYNKENYEKAADILLHEKLPDTVAATRSSFLTEEYFDTKDFVLNSKGVQLLISIETKPASAGKKTKPEIVRQILLGPFNDKNDLTDTVLVNTNMEAVFKYKNYKKSASIYEKHELLRYIKRSERPLFIDLVRRFGIDEPLLLKKALVFSGNRRVLSLNNSDGQAYIEISFNDGTIDSNGWENPAFIISVTSIGTLNVKQKKTYDFITDKLGKIEHLGKEDQRLNYKFYCNNYVFNNPLIKLSIKYSFFNKIFSLILIIIFSAAVFFVAGFFLKKKQ